MSVKTRKKLIEVALPLEAINVASAREKSIRQGHPSTLHLWWARRPLAAARAVIFAQMVDDPSSWPERFPTEEAQDTERQRLFRIIEQLVLWENTTNEKVIEQARSEIRRSWRDTCEDNKDHPQARELFDPDTLPGFHDPFAGGGALPLEAQRLGFEAWASDLNPVAVLINKAMIEIPPKFAGRPPIGPLPRGADQQIPVSDWTGAKGLAEDVRRYGAWMREAATKQIGHQYPKVLITEETAHGRPDLKPYVGRQLIVIAWLWARTAKSPNPAFAHVDVPLVSTFTLSKKGKGTWIDPVIRADQSGFDFVVRLGDSPRLQETVNRRGASCVMSGTPIPFTYLREAGKAHQLGARLMAIVAEGDGGRVYLSPTREHEQAANAAIPHWSPDVEIQHWPGCTNVVVYGLTEFSDLFTPRQTVTLGVLSEIIRDVRDQVVADGSGTDLGEDVLREYADAVAVYLAFAVSKLADRGSTSCGWDSSRDSLRNTFGRQALPMVWDYAEANPLSSSTGSWTSALDQLSRVLDALPATIPGFAAQLDAQAQTLSQGRVVSTDPPYFDNVPYADLSDFFYVWMRRSLQSTLPDLFSTVAVPKAQELVAHPTRHGDKESAHDFFVEGMTKALERLANQAHPAFTVTIYYAFRQAETETNGTASTGWEVFLNAVRRAGFAVQGTWPMRTELGNRMRSVESNALASSIVLVCRRRDSTAVIATRREFIAALGREMPRALRHMQHGNIAPVDLAQSAIGPGMAIFTRYEKVLDADGSPLSVREALALINQALDEVLTQQEGEFDADTRWAVEWFDQHGFGEGSFGDADNLSRAKVTSVMGMVDAGIVDSGRGKVRLLRPDELPSDWDPVRDQRLTVWEATHHLLRTLDQGEQAAADLARQLGGVAGAARDLAYRLYVLCERKKRAQEALAYNALVQSWPEIQRLAADSSGMSAQGTLEI